MNDQKQNPKLVPMHPSIKTVASDTALVSALNNFVDMVEKVNQNLETIAGCADVIATYIEKKGLKEELFTQEEIDEMREGGDDDEKDELIPGA